MLKWLAIVLISGFFIRYGCANVNIAELSGTNNAEYGTSHSLRCNYDYENETGVEIKWFYNGDNQIFLWVPNRSKPNALEAWKAVLDTNDTVPDHDLNHSVIHFKELNFNLSGYYTCKVTGDEHEDTKTEKMIVYRPASFVEFDLVSEENNTITLSCSVFELYPKPTINVTGLYLEKNGTVQLYLRNETTDGDQNTLFNLTKTFTFNKEELLASVVEFSCSVGIADTNYSLVKKFEYIKSGYETTTSENSAYHLNETTISPENEINIKNSSLDNNKKQGGRASYNDAPLKWILVLVLFLTYS